MNGFDYYQMPDGDRDGMLQGSLDESSQHIQPTNEMPATKDHPILLLKKYCYKPENIQQKDETEYESDFQGSLQGMNMDKIDKALGIGGGDASSAVKVGHPSCVAMAAEIALPKRVKPWSFWKMSQM